MDLFFFYSACSYLIYISDYSIINVRILDNFDLHLEASNAMIYNMTNAEFLVWKKKMAFAKY